MRILSQRRTTKEVIWGFQGEYRFLSNFWPAQVFDYPTVEHAYQAGKTVSERERQQIKNAKTPGKAKRLSRSLILRPDWDEIKLELMETLLREKFKIPELKAKLLITGNRILVEGNIWHDNFWGDCGCRKCVNKKGKNHLGLLLMKIRNEIKEGK